jgi:DNA-binding NarL/FixJ family response regulator
VETIKPVSILVVSGDAVRFQENVLNLGEQTAGEFILIGTARTVHEAISQTRGLRPDIVLLDMGRGDTGVELIPQLQGILPELRIIGMTLPYDDADRELALRAGATRFVSRFASLPELIRVMRRQPPNPCVPLNDRAAPASLGATPTHGARA